MDLLSYMLKNDSAVRQELLERHNTNEAPMFETSGFEAVASESARVGMEKAILNIEPDRFGSQEAVVLFEGRPSLLIQNNGFELPELEIWRERLRVSFGLLERVIPSVCRIELKRHPLSAFYPMIGTGWLIAEDTLVTNRHVAEFFGFKQGNRFLFRNHPEGGHVEIRADFLAEYGVALENEYDVAEILHIEESSGLDMAFLKLNSSRPLSQPIVLGDPTPGEMVATVGYPGNDPRVPANKLQPIFDNKYRVKRLAPGMIMGSPGDDVLQHDCSTLKGSSGSPVFSLDTGCAVGLHFAGQFGIANSAVNSRQLKDELSRLNVQVPSTWIQPPETNGPADHEDSPGDRGGYQSDFLGSGNHVSLPGLDHKDALEIPAPVGGKELKYEHFSVVMHRDRGLAICAGVNIDGSSLRFIPRGDRWSRDSRIDSGQQHDNALYKHNDYDRGHLVRRLDPVWGDEETAKRANDDTFFYTNAAPQHKNLNQKLWVRLEEYVLDNARAHDLKISVFTGPVFDSGDPIHRSVQIPRRFWKIVAFTDKDTGELRSTGYLLDQSHLIIDMPEEFAFGAFKTFQVSVDLIARMTGMKIDELVAADVLGEFESAQNLPLTSLSDMVLSKPGDADGGSSTGGSRRKISLEKLQQELVNLDIPESHFRKYAKEDSLQSRAFYSRITVNEETVEVSDDESAVLMSSFNGLSRWRRQKRYRRKINSGWDGLRIVSEGDSWFQYPVMLDDVIDHLFDRYAISSLGAAGDLLQDMIMQDEVFDEVTSERPHAFLISGGGNDLLGGGRLQEYLRPFNSSNSPSECIKKSRLRGFVDGITSRYKRIFKRLTREFPNLQIFCHGYDYVIPDSGRWLGGPMEQIGYEDKNFQREILRIIIDRFNEVLIETVSAFDQVHHVDCRGAVRDHQWYDELHPTDAGYGTVASRFASAIEQHCRQV